MSGYWQLPLAPDDIEKTAFTTAFELFEFPTMPFGLCNAPTSFQRAMDSVLSGLKWRSCIVYLDNSLAFSTEFDSHLQDLETVFQRLRQYSHLRTKKSDILCTWLHHPDFVSILLKSMMLLILKFLRISLNSSHLWVLRHIIVALFRHTPLLLSLYFDHFVIACLFNGLITNSILSMNSNNFLLQHLFFHPDRSKPFLLQTDTSSTAIAAIFWLRSILIVVNASFRTLVVNCMHQNASMTLANRNYSQLFGDAKSFVSIFSEFSVLWRPITLIFMADVRQPSNRPFSSLDP